MAEEKYKCIECGRRTKRYSEGQCPHCKTLDTLYLAEEVRLDEEFETFDIFGDEYTNIEDEIEF